MSEMQEGREGQATTLEEGLFTFAVWTLVWAPVCAVAFLKTNAAFLLVTPIILVAAFGNQKRRWALSKHKLLVVVLAAFIAGFYCCAYLEQNSEEFKARSAVLVACTQIKPCVERVQLGGFEIGALAP